MSDITYLPTLAGWWYLATVIDLASREVIGYAMADHHRAFLVVGALRMAAARGGLKEGCITHSDRGSEYTSREHRALGGTRATSRARTSAPAATSEAGLRRMGSVADLRAVLAKCEDIMGLPYLTAAP
ncbi:integrase core domain protein [Streptomyces zinciresistens K42]|uniref:Integrase core domain protein n=1 Tax=Streptomyces zinciresistens K42 TaxID=700597 RepID=G2G666_9ACTN|nr:integrase core domain protein [Streptomyces zinciresistens K42]